MIKRSSEPIVGWSKRLIAMGLEAIFPLRCGGCGNKGTVWCSRCHRNLHVARSPSCHHCGFPISSSKSCEACSSLDIPLQVRSFAAYTPPLSTAILQLKYRPNQELATVMADWLASIYRQKRLHVDVIIPVPLSRRRQWKRGYNQVELIAEKLADMLELPVDRTSLRRIRDTSSQVGLLPSERRENVYGAIRGDADKLSGLSLLLIDDLITTGATILACAIAAGHAGASDLTALTVGRAVYSSNGSIL